MIKKYRHPEKMSSALAFLDIPSYVCMDSGCLDLPVWMALRIPSSTMIVYISNSNLDACSDVAAALAMCSSLKRLTINLNFTSGNVKFTDADYDRCLDKFDDLFHLMESNLLALTIVYYVEVDITLGKLYETRTVSYEQIPRGTQMLPSFQRDVISNYRKAQTVWLPRSKRRLPRSPLRIMSTYLPDS